MTLEIGVKGRAGICSSTYGRVVLRGCYGSGRRIADSTTLGHPAHAHLDTRSTRTWTPDPRPLGQAVGAQRRRVALLV